jgi:2-polyprenyl-3-methyl-5-hydroxy-6-metoxy-1,4-benzoquinol methylase
MIFAVDRKEDHTDKLYSFRQLLEEGSMLSKQSAALAEPERELEELTRSAEEARSCVLITADRRQVQRYLDPPADTPYGLEYAYHLLGDVAGKTVLDLGCGKGENLVPLAERKANVTGIDISPDLVSLARRRIEMAGVKATVRVGSAYHTGLPDESVDAIFCIAVVHHLEIPRVRDEMWRVLKRGGFVVLSEPIRFSRTYGAIRKLLPANKHSSEHEHPLNHEELRCLCERFTRENLRHFRLPFVPLVERLRRSGSHSARLLSARVIHAFPLSQHYATVVVMRLRK